MIRPLPSPHALAGMMAWLLLSFALTACASPTTAPPPATAIPPTLTAAPSPTAAPTPTGPPAVVAFLQGGDVWLWEEATGQSRLVFAAGDATAMTLSDDGEMIVFLRREEVTLPAGAWREQSSLWAVHRGGAEPRELLAADDWRRQLGAAPEESTTFLDLAWLPRTHRLLASGARYIVQAEGLSHARPEGVILVDTETRALARLADPAESLRFIPAPDARQIALLSATALEFVAADGSDRRRDVLTFPAAGVPEPVFPGGVWTRDGGAFLLVAPALDAAPPVVSLSIWRVPADGRPAAPLATIAADSHPASVTFAPDGGRAAYYRWPEPAWLITPLTYPDGAGASPLAVPGAVELGYANLHWSPSGNAYAFPDSFAGDLARLCPGAASAADTCGAPLALGGTAAGLRWLDASRFLYLTREPASLSLVTLTGETASARPIVGWAAAEAAGMGSFAGVVPAPEP